MLITILSCETTAKVFRQPLPEIVGTAARDGMPGLDYTVWVDCTVRNNGAGGSIEVSATLKNGGYWNKRQVVHVPENMEDKVTFTFSEASLLGTGLSGFQYNCEAHWKS